MEGMEEPFTFDLAAEDPAAAEDDRVFEEIEAPKFVDLTAPDRYLPDDGSWFCDRIGCDQNHEEVDPEELHRSFVLRVLAARSPNVRLHKALNGRSAIPRCPRTAPVKSAKAGIHKHASTDSARDKASICKLKSHPISALRSTLPANPKPDPSSSVFKCLTTPRIKKCVPSADPFRSTRIPKVSAPMATNRTVARSLAFFSPQKIQKSKSSISEVCSGMGSLQIGSKTKHVSRHMCKSVNFGAADRSRSDVPRQLRRPAAKLKNKDQKELNTAEIDLSQRTCNAQNETDIDGKLRKAIEGKKTCSDGACETLHKQVLRAEEIPEKDEVQNGKVSISSCKERNNPMDSSRIIDDDKENISTTPIHRNTNTEKENISSVPYNHSATKSYSAPAKSSQPEIQGTLRKLKHTNPKPFRLRTDERGILREANLERRAQVSVLGEIKPSCLKRDKNTGLEKAAIAPQRRKQLQNSKETAEKMLKLEVSEHGALQCESSAKKMIAESGRGIKLSKAFSDGGTPNKSITRSQLKKPTTVPRGPVFHKINVPKGCTKRLQNFA